MVFILVLPWEDSTIPFWLDLWAHHISAATVILAVFNAADVRIRDLHLTGSTEGYGVLVQQSTHLTVEQLVIDPIHFGITVGEGSDKAIIQKNTISQADAGILVADSKEVKVKDTILKANSQGLLFGIFLNKADTTTATSNMISDTEFGIYVGSSSGVQLSSNTITTSKEVGIRLEGATNSTVRKNTVTDSKINGIAISNGDNKDNTIEQNTIKNSANLDALDTSVGNKTAGTANTWKDNTCKTSDPAGLCKK